MPPVLHEHGKCAECFGRLPQAVKTVSTVWMLPPNSYMMPSTIPHALALVSTSKRSILPTDELILLTDATDLPKNDGTSSGFAASSLSKQFDTSVVAAGCGSV